MVGINSKRIIHYKCANMSITRLDTAPPLWQEVSLGEGESDYGNTKKYNNKFLITPLGIMYMFYYDAEDNKIKVNVSLDKGGVWTLAFPGVECAGVDTTYGRDFEVYMDETGMIHLIMKPETSNIFVTDTEPENPVLNDIWMDIS